MRTPTQGIKGGLYDPRLHTKDFPPDDEANDGHAAALACGVTRYLTFGSGSGDRNIEFWRLPSDGGFILEGATIALPANWTQAGTAQPLVLSVEVERKDTSNYWLTLAQAVLLEDRFVGTVYDVMAHPSVWGLRARNDDGLMISPHRAFDGRVELIADHTTDTFDTDSTSFAWSHGIAPDERVWLQSSGGVLPAGITAGAYFKRGSGTTSLQLSTTMGGAAVNFTTNGTPPFGIVPVEAGVEVSAHGIYVAPHANRFRGCKVRFRGRTTSGSNNWSGTADVALQLRMVR